jgi:hypothetical protein
MMRAVSVEGLAMSLEELAARHGGTVEFHRFARLLPEFGSSSNPEETPQLHLERLRADIEENGQNHEIVLFEGKILDGRNRYVACLMAGREPRFRQFDGDELAALRFVASENICRRQLSSSQCAVVAVRYAKLYAQLQEAAEERKRATVPLPGERGFQSRESKNGDSDESSVAQQIAPHTGASESGSENGHAAAPGGPDFEGLGISGSIANKLREAQIRLDEIVPAEGASEKPDLGDLEQLAGLTRAEVIEVERCVEDRLRGREVKPAVAVPAKKKRDAKKKAAGESAEQLAKRFNTNKAYVRQAQKLEEKAPAKVQEVCEGRKTLTEVAREERGLPPDAPRPERFHRKLSRFIHELAEETEAAHSRARRVIAYLTSLLEETGMQARKELARQALTTIIPELQMAGKILEIEVNA